MNIVGIKNLENFWYHNKLKLFVAIIVIVVIGYMVIGMGGEGKPDVQVAYLTNGPVVPDDVSKNIGEYLAPVIQDVNKDRRKEIAFVPLYVRTMLDMEFTSNESQILLMDGNSLKQYISLGAFDPLDDTILKYGLDISENPEIKVEGKKANEVHVYALPVKNLKLLQKIGFPADNYYLTIRVADGKDKKVMEKNKNAHAVLDELLRDGNK